MNQTHNRCHNVPDQSGIRTSSVNRSVNQRSYIGNTTTENTNTSRKLNIA